jgi:uncharacterized repeat protein (TIGR02543 family)
MKQNILSVAAASARKVVLGTALSLGLLTLPIVARAQQVVIVGFLGNFDVLNNTGEQAHGFEIQMEGVHAADIYRIFGAGGPFGYPTDVIRYGQGTATDYATGVYVRWMSPWDPATQSFKLATPIPGNNASVPGDSCWRIGMPQTYETYGCEHFGISAYKNPTQTIYRWLVADPQNPGNLMYATQAVSLPAPIWTVTPPAQLGAQPVVAAEVQAPQPPQPELQFGEAQWVKVFKTEIAREVQLEELFGDNAAVVPEDPAQAEVAWKLLQHNPHSANSGVLRNQGGLNGGGARAVVRRYEYYQYSGAYDSLDHGAICIDPTCTVPDPSEIGEAIGAQNVAANVAIPGITVTKVGNGTVTGAGGAINCGGSCTANLALDTPVTLIANPGGNVFTGWSGACTGTQLNCSVVINDALNVTATFTPQFTLSMGRSNPGTVIGTPNGNDRQLNCGGNCSAKFTSGTTVTLIAAPPLGKTFASWSGSGAGACAGSAALTCDVTITKDTSVQANFNK